MLCNGDSLVLQDFGNELRSLILSLEVEHAQIFTLELHDTVSKLSYVEICLAQTYFRFGMPK